MTTPQTNRSHADRPVKRNYTRPTVEARGRIEDLTRWVGQRQKVGNLPSAGGWNIWTQPGTGS
ncbi:MAG: hypothetical protein AAF726_16435 [Planctomycetota bacterium]